MKTARRDLNSGRAAGNEIYRSTFGTAHTDAKVPHGLISTEEFLSSGR